jgi:hypothetical protein
MQTGQISQTGNNTTGKSVAFIGITQKLDDI